MILIANAKDGTISTFVDDGERLLPVSTVDIGGPGMPLAVGGGLVFAGSSDPSGVTVLDTDLKVLDRVAAQGVPAYLCLARGYLVSASYHDSAAEAWRIDGGKLVPVGVPVHYLNLHCALAVGPHCYLASLGEDLVAQCRIDDGLQLLDPATCPAPQGSGPRHIVASPDECQLYVSTEFSGEIVRYTRDRSSGTLAPAQRMRFVPERGLAHSRLGADPRAEGLMWGSDLHLSGSLLFAAERNAATISALPVAEDGSLGQPCAHSDVIPQPRGFAVLEGSRLVVASETENVAALYRHDARGQLTQLDEVTVGNGANWIVTA